MSNASGANPKLCAIFVTFEMNENLIENVKRFRHAIPGGKVIVVDNSSQNYKMKYGLKEQLLDISATFKYINNKINCRFEAYNLATEVMSSELVVFRTDDDTFYEEALARVLKKQHIKTFAITPHYFNNFLQWGDTYQQPLESVVFNRKFLQSLLPFSSEAGGDWKLLRYAFSSVSPIKINVPLLNKAAHGR